MQKNELSQMLQSLKIVKHENAGICRTTDKLRNFKQWPHLVWAFHAQTLSKLMQIYKPQMGAYGNNSISGVFEQILTKFVSE